MTQRIHMYSSFHKNQTCYFQGLFLSCSAGHVQTRYGLSSFLPIEAALVLMHIAYVLTQCPHLRTAKFTPFYSL